MNNIPLKSFFTIATVILTTGFLVMCATAEVKVTPKQSTATPPQPMQVTAKLPPKTIDSLTVLLHFEFDKATLTESGIAELGKAVKFVKRYPYNKIQIDGYTDMIGTEDYNIKLSERRANVTKEYLVKNAEVKPENLTTLGHGTSDPVGDEKTEAGRAMNRRAVISIVSD
jgi:outer membrane protein OmpA-like peptidoglycan-associated protein